MRTKKLYLGTPCGDINIGSYVTDRIESYFPDLHTTLKDMFEGVIHRILGEELGEDWERITTKFKDIIPETTYYVPNDLIESFYMDILKIGNYHTGDTTFRMKKKYPWVENFYLKIKPQEIKDMTILLVDILLERFKLLKELEDSGIINRGGYLVPETLGELSRMAPNLFDWYIQSIIEREGLDQVIIISEEEDLKNLRSWMPAVMTSIYVG